MNTTKNLYQWDINQRLIDVAGKHVDFPINNEIYRVEVTDGECMIPDELLQNYGRIKVYECMADGTLKEFVFDVTERPQPPDYVYTPTERLTFDGLVQKVDDAVADMERRAAAGEFNGKDGKDGKDGVDGQDGKDYQITESDYEAIAEKSAEKLQPTITELNNTKVGYSEVVNNQLLMYSDDTKKKLLATLDLPSDGVNDVQINGTSIVADGVADIPLANSSKTGVVKTDANLGVSATSDGRLFTFSAENSLIDRRDNAYRAITPKYLDYAVKAAMCDGKGAEWTAEEQAKARARIGEAQFELIEEITLTESVKAIKRTTEPNGTPYNFESVLIYANAKLASGEGSGNWGIQLTNGNTIVKNIAFGDNVTESYTKQYLKIYNNHGFLDAESYQIASSNYGHGYTRFPNAIRLDGLIEFEGITQIEVCQYNNKTFASGSVFKIYAIRR